MEVDFLYLVHAMASSPCLLPYVLAQSVWLCLIAATLRCTNLLIAWVYPPPCQGLLIVLAHHMHRSRSQYDALRELSHLQVIPI